MQAEAPGAGVCLSSSGQQVEETWAQGRDCTGADRFLWACSHCL